MCYHRLAMESAGVRSNITKIYLYKFLSEFYLVIPILIPYYEFHRFSTAQIFLIQASYALSFLLFEIPSGYLADVIGRKKTLILGAAFFPLGLGIYAFTSSFISFFLAEFVLALGNSMRSGSDSALIYDTLVQLDNTASYKTYEGRIQFFTRIGTSASSVLGGFIAAYSLKLPFYINIFTGALMFPLALSLTEPRREKAASAQPFRDILRVCGRGLRHVRLRIDILYLSLLMSSGIIGVWAYFLYYRSLGLGLGYFGILFALFQLSSAMGSEGAHRIHKKIGEKRSLCLPLGIPLVFFLLGAFPSPILIPAVFLNAYLWGHALPLVMDSLNRSTSSEVRATVLSVAQMTGSLSYVILGPMFGGLVDHLGLGKAFILLGAFSMIGMSLALRALFRVLRSRRSSDPIGLNG